jgi:hypothetical protein
VRAFALGWALMRHENRFTRDYLERRQNFVPLRFCKRYFGLTCQTANSLV